MFVETTEVYTQATLYTDDAAHHRQAVYNTLLTTSLSLFPPLKESIPDWATTTKNTLYLLAIQVIQFTISKFYASDYS